MLYRKAWQALASWSASPRKKALLLTGARQVGKTTLVRAFARERYECFAELNFLLDTDAHAIFDHVTDVESIIAGLTAHLRTPLVPGKTLVLLDEIQECPQARTAIKFLVEDGRFDYIETGSLLGVNNREVTSYPVGFEETLRIHPLDFEEFCLAEGVQPETIDRLRTCFSEEHPVEQSVHDVMLKLFSAYIVVGGMPEIVQRYVTTHDIAQVLALQNGILTLYRQDIAKYATGGDKSKIHAIFDAIPSQLDAKNRRFVLADLAKSARQNRYASSFLRLTDAGVALPCYNVSALVAPLEASANHSLFKLFMGDVGLLCAASLGNIQLDLLNGNLEVNMGSITENAIAQELTAHGFDVRYYNGKRYGEIDFVVQRGRSVIPIEVKSGADWTRHRALSNIMNANAWPLDSAYVLCKGNVRREGRICYLPLYFAMFLEQDALPASLPFKVDLSALR